MILDLPEAHNSLDFYAKVLEHQCSIYQLLRTQAAGANQPLEIAAASLQKIVAELTQRHREAQILSILISKEFARRIPDLLDQPAELANVVQAQNRLMPALNKASAVIDEHRSQEDTQRRAEADAPRKSMMEDWKEFRERRQSERETAAARARSEFLAPDASAND